jgi:hypothetical protein
MAGLLFVAIPLASLADRPVGTLTAFSTMNQKLVPGPEHERPVMREVMDEHGTRLDPDQRSATCVFGQPVCSTRGSVSD